MKTAIQVLDVAQLKDVAGGQSKIVCTVSQEYITCTGNGMTVRTPRNDSGTGGGGSNTGRGRGRGRSSGGGSSGNW